MERITSSALVARRVEYGEADLVLSLLTLEKGKLSALARAARRSRKRFGGALALFIVGEAHLRAPSRGGELWLLERFEAREDLGGAIGADLVKLAHGSYLLELTRELWPADQPEPAGFALLVEALRALAGSPPSPSLLRAYELRALGAVGLAPALSSCVACDRLLTADEDAAFELARGGVVCAACGGAGLPLSAAARAELLALREGPLAEAARRTPRPQVARALRELALELVRYSLGKELRSLQFILQLAGGERPARPG
jgi:DNA repair protein RecO (recombination protein O)